MVSTPVLDIRDMLGRYPPRDGTEQLEFQINTMLIWVLRPLSMPETACIADANLILPARLDDIARVCDFAVQEAGSEFLGLTSIAIKSDGTAVYDLCVDPDEDGWMHIQRAVDGALSLSTP